MQKGYKSVVYTAVKDTLSDAWLEMEELPPGQRIDVMAFIQKHKKFGCTIFDDLHDMYLDKITHCKLRDSTLI